MYKLLLHAVQDGDLKEWGQEYGVPWFRYRPHQLAIFALNAIPGSYLYKIKAASFCLLISTPSGIGGMLESLQYANFYGGDAADKPL